MSIELSTHPREFLDLLGGVPKRNPGIQFTDLSGAGFETIVDSMTKEVGHQFLQDMCDEARVQASSKLAVEQSDWPTLHAVSAWLTKTISRADRDFCEENATSIIAVSPAALSLLIATGKITPNLGSDEPFAGTYEGRNVYLDQYCRGIDVLVLGQQWLKYKINKGIVGVPLMGGGHRIENDVDIWVNGALVVHIHIS